MRNGRPVGALAFAPRPVPPGFGSLRGACPTSPDDPFQVHVYRNCRNVLHISNEACDQLVQDCGWYQHCRAPGDPYDWCSDYWVSQAGGGGGGAAGGGGGGGAAGGGGGGGGAFPTTQSALLPSFDLSNPVIKWGLVGLAGLTAVMLISKMGGRRR